MNAPFDNPHLTQWADQRGWILQFAKKTSVGAEIGVFRGHFSAVIARELKPRALYLIDPWTKNGERFGWRGIDTNNDSITTEEAKSETEKRLRPFSATSFIYAETFFADFVKKYSGPKWDFAYLDTSHQYESTKEELALLDKLIANDGVILGDDWIPDPSHNHHGVMRAVNEFVKVRRWQIVVAGLHNQWCIRRTPHYRDT